jgi:CheY-like chemotaxis protein
MIEQTLMNLVANSRDAVPEGGEVTITTNAVSLDEMAARQKVGARPGSFVQLTVSDNGCGISPQNLPRIFEPFFTTKDVGKGTGLGLATVHGIVKQHDGWIEVNSEVGRGTTLHILLPAVAAPEAVHEQPPAANTEVRGAGECILVVEDEAAVRTLVAGVLTRLGYSVLQADTGASALKLWNQHRDRIQLLLTDLVMPEGINGRELADQLREENPKLKVIFTSGYSAEVAGADFAINEGGNFLQKPYAPTRLAQTVRHCLNG